jgi:hypothetical protein
MTRRRALLSIGLAAPLLSTSTTAAATATTTTTTAETAAAAAASLSTALSSPERAALLGAIARGADEATVAPLVEALLPLDPSRGTGATSDALGGTWELIWSAKAEAFSPLLRLPRPLKPESYQLLGRDAEAAGVGSGRVVQVLKGGILGGGVGDNGGGGGGSSVASLVPPLAEIWLSSGVAPAADGAGDTLEIFPPFRLEVGRGGGGGAQQSGGRRTTLVEAGSDADFRAVNGRTSEAQAAPKNRYVQAYLEGTGGDGDLRVSVVAAGDPVIVGATFVHRRRRRRAGGEEEGWR